MMQSHTQNRKRPAPGTSPSSMQSSQTGLQSSQTGLQFPVMQDVPQVAHEQYNDWGDQGMLGSSVASYSETNPYSNNAYATTSNGPVALNTTTPSTQPFQNMSNQLVRRTPNQQLVSREGQFDNDAWLEDGGNPQTQTTPWEEGTDDEDLEQKALTAKKDAQAKRKTIPPFVQKLSSFLDESNNTDLIRWSDDGNSFIVLDEDEFANTLIPELFKSNKYASFVRQLNMYGFHKKVGLSDNSMRASEKKAKNPSEFYNPYFKRGRPELLWLIHKPKSGLPHPKRKREEIKGKPAGDSSDEDKKVTGEPSGIGDSQVKPSEPTDHDQGQELATLPNSELQSVRQELQALQRQQRFISKVITQVREQNHQLYQQATAFQALHDRHENSISAILTFLATFYNRNIEGMGPQNLASMFANAIPQNNQQRGTVEDMGDYKESDTNTSNQLQRAARRPQLLLPPPTENLSSSPASRITTESPDPGPLGTTPQNFSNGASDERFGSGRSIPSQSQQHLPFQGQVSANKSGQSNPSTTTDASANDIMALIKDANASAAASPANDPSLQSTASFDFPAALSAYQSANGNTPLTPQERDNMLALMAKEQQGGGIHNDYAARSSNGLATSNNALTTPNPPPMPSLDKFAANQQQLDMLQRLQQEQDAKVQSLADRLQPLSPTGSIPGLHNGNAFSEGDGNTTDFGQPSELDLNNFINNGDYFTGGDQMGVGLTGNVGEENDLFNTPDFGLDFGGTGDNGLDGTSGFDFGAEHSSGLGDDTGYSEGLQGGNVSNQEFDERGRIVESVSSEATSPTATGMTDEGANEDRGVIQSRNEGPPKKRRMG
ncbi:hypothetical protein EV356DRAFT_517994 [Viridothelium virens]|uniref:HSF-type DNA-binding domain-containing protein n=1 Tax=Viridothelium virens TaxID=1048519 RepID=A0A6A6HLI1_VIRVR|nr:hypothetical protein EV356DRAFT_517994 [Viridothelium virens]